MGRTDRRPVVVLATNLLQLGGTEKGLMNDALNLPPERWDVRVVGVWGLGPRAATLERAGIAVDTAERDQARLTRLFEGADIVHVYRQGRTEHVVPAAARAAGVPVLVETNIFGHLDRSRDREQFACHLFVSKFCLLRYRGWIGDSTSAFHDRHRTQHHTHDFDALRRHLPPKAAAKRALGLDPTRPVVGRIGRAADGKWRTMLVDMLPRLVDLVPDVQMMFVGTTPAIEARLRRLGVLERCSIHPTTMHNERLATYFGACDVFVTAAVGGESQGLALGEAMSCGVPVVTCSTPWVDNAQIEFVDHGRNGYVANHPRPFAEAVADLLRDEHRRAAFGTAARKTVESAFHPGILGPQLEHLYDSLLAGMPAPSDWTPSPAEVEAFATEYERRLGAEYSKLTLPERAQMRLVRARERWREAAAHRAANLRSRFSRAVR